MPHDPDDLLTRAHAHTREYLNGLRERPVRADPSQPRLRALVGDTLTDDGENPAAVIDSLIAAGETGVMPTAGPRFFGYVVGGAFPVGVAADWLAAGWDHPPGTPLAAPLGCAIEEIVEAWALDLLDLPRESSVGIVTGATMGNFVGVAAARHRLLEREGWDVEARGLFGAPAITVLVGADAHPTHLAALRMTGLGSDRVTRVATDAEGRMSADAFRAALEAAQGPVLVCAQVGQVNTGACDPLSIIGPACRARGAWLHVDGAFGLWARAAPGRRHLAAGAEHADSWSVDAHKWLNTPYDGAFAIVRDRAAHVGAMAVSASYLPQVADGRDPSAYAPELSRRARGLPIYAVLRALGRRGVADLVERCCVLAGRMRDRLTAAPGVTCLNAVELNQAIFQVHPLGAADPAASDALTAATVERVRNDATCWVQTAEWRGRTIMRFSVSNHMTNADDIDRSAEAILTALAGARADLAA